MLLSLDSRMESQPLHVHGTASVGRTGGLKSPYSSKRALSHDNASEMQLLLLAQISSGNSGSFDALERSPPCPGKYERRIRRFNECDWYGRASKTLVSHLAQNITHNSGSLTSLHLVGMYTWAAVWTALLASGGGGGGGVHLTDLTTDELTPELLAYLASYAGLRRLTLLHPAGKTQADTDRFADTFFGSVLPLHTASLVEPACPASSESQWSFGAQPHCVDAICAYKTWKASRWASTPRTCRMWSYILTLLLHTAARLPSLASLTIASVIPAAPSAARTKIHYVQGWPKHSLGSWV
ncbi:hypothetical protein B0H14DRAFT_3430897 [Mycena olivaceomarginata]|nr:hypothetical protein B0H14DRAFT_3430897 [Mycena olivaceomarginata]